MVSGCAKGKKAVVLLSGGIDSATTLFYAKKKGYKIWALAFDYNQKHKKEINFAKKLAALAQVNFCSIKISIPWSQSSLVSLKKKIPKRKVGGVPSTYVAGRNIIFLSYAASYAESVKANSIFIGAHTLDYSGYPDCREEFLKAFNKAVNLGLVGADINILRPLVKKNKKQIIRLGFNLGVPFESTWSCYQGGRLPCLECDSCRYRTEGFISLGLEDPLLKKNGIDCKNI